MLDETLFGPPFVLIDSQGRKVPTGQPIRDIERAYQLLGGEPRAAAIVGTLVDGVWAVDVDPADAGIDAAVGDAAAEMLIGWAKQHQLGWWVRESGRPGGRHVLVEVPDDQLLDVLRQRVCLLATQLDVRQVARTQWLTVRKPLRLLGSPHRLGLPAPNLGGPLTGPRIPPAAAPQRQTDQRDKPARRGVTDRDTRTVSASGGQGDTSPSGQEYGRSMYCARSGYTAQQAWPGAFDCQVASRGERSWLRYTWSKVITYVAAEQGLSEEQAWEHVQRETPQRASELGRDRWRSTVWLPGLAEAATDRPRRYTDPRAANNPDNAGPITRHAGTQEDITILREGLRAAAKDLLTRQGRRPQVHHTMTALMDTLAVAIAGDGRISLRRMAEESLLADSTVDARRAEALQGGLITKIATYRDDGQRCDLYAIGPTAQPYIQALRKTRARLVHPPTSAPPTTGKASLRLLRAAHAADRRCYLSPPLTAAEEKALSASYPDRSHPAARVIRSRAYQLRWWRQLSNEQKAQRRRQRRTELDRKSPEEYQDWLQWLNQRNRIDESIRRILAGAALPGDHEIVATAPATVHHGQRDPLWRTGGTPSQLVNGKKPDCTQGEQIMLDLPLLGAA